MCEHPPKALITSEKSSTQQDSQESRKTRSLQTLFSILSLSLSLMQWCWLASKHLPCAFSSSFLLDTSCLRFCRTFCVEHRLYYLRWFLLGFCTCVPTTSVPQNYPFHMVLSSARKKSTSSRFLSQVCTTCVWYLRLCLFVFCPLAKMYNCPSNNCTSNHPFHMVLKQPTSRFCRAFCLKFLQLSLQQSHMVLSSATKNVCVHGTNMFQHLWRLFKFRQQQFGRGAK